VRRRDNYGRLVFGLAGHESEIVSERGQGGLGSVGGSGEREMVVQRTRINSAVAKVRKQLDELRQRRSLQRAKRKTLGHQTVALLGYTNAGKSSLMSVLSGQVRTQNLCAQTCVHTSAGKMSLMNVLQWSGACTDPCVHTRAGARFFALVVRRNCLPGCPKRVVVRECMSTSAEADVDMRLDILQWQHQAQGGFHCDRGGQCQAQLAAVDARGVG
jgi:hypothetical protein